MATTGVEFHRQWIGQCEAAQRIRQDFGLVNALDYLIGEKLLRFVEVAEWSPDFAEELPDFLTAIKSLFSLADVGDYAVHLERTKPLTASQRGAIRAISSISTYIQ
jgi:hypothetical protein